MRFPISRVRMYDLLCCVMLHHDRVYLFSSIGSTTADEGKMSECEVDDCSDGKIPCDVCESEGGPPSVFVFAMQCVV